jgi:SAM-dependent methyltransferase|tara:strand:- start:257 stop:838 length:582 start_codon:yes stop_codon:yes gene_type:complete
MNNTEIKYWNNFYSIHKDIEDCSDFCTFVMEFFKNNNDIVNVLDCGCGNGRDSYALSNTYNVVGIDSSGFIPVTRNNTNFSANDFITFDKRNYDLIYSRFTLHSITDEQQLSFLQSINNNSYLVIETRSLKGENDNVVHGKTHYRNYTDLTYLKKILTDNNFQIIFANEDIDMAKYKNENPICIRVICKKKAV